MNQGFSVDLDDKPVRFTAEGKMSVLDAIRAVTDSPMANAIWKKMKEDHEEILEYCQQHEFEEDGSSLVIDSAGWERLWRLLPRYVFNTP